MHISVNHVLFYDLQFLLLNALKTLYYIDA